MKVFNFFVRLIFGLILSLSIGLWVTTMTLNATVMNRYVVMGWFDDSGVYENGVSAIVKITPEADDQNNLINAEVMSQALAKTYTSEYVKSQTEVVLNSVYDWLDGDTTEVSFSISVDEKADDFKANLVAAIEPELESLPECNRSDLDSENITCVPSGVSPSDYAEQLVQLPQGEDAIFSQAITNETVGLDSNSDSMQMLRLVYQVVGVMAWVLPIALVVSALFVVIASDKKLLKARKIGVRVAVSAAFSLLGGVVLYFVANAIDVRNFIDSSDSEQIDEIASFLSPFVSGLVSDFAFNVCLYSAILLTAGLAVWLVFFLLLRNRGREQKGFKGINTEHNAKGVSESAFSRLPEEQKAELGNEEQENVEATASEEVESKK